MPQQSYRPIKPTPGIDRFSEPERFAMRRAAYAAVMSIVTLCIGTIGYYILDHGAHSVVDCVFMSFITTNYDRDVNAAHNLWGLSA